MNLSSGDSRELLALAIALSLCLARDQDQAELGRLAGVPTPITDAHVTLSESMMGRDYHAEGVNLEKMGLEGKTIEQVLDYVTRG